MDEGNAVLAMDVEDVGTFRARPMVRWRTGGENVAASGMGSKVGFEPLHC